MRNHKSTVGGEYSDCMRACVASLLGMEHAHDMPHFFVYGEADPWGRLQEWLRETVNLALVTVLYPPDMTPEQVRHVFGTVNPDVYYLMGGSVHGFDHVVVCYNEEIYNNPSIYPEEFKAPHSSGYWHIMVLTPV